MATTAKINVLARTAESKHKNKKNKPSYITNYNCLSNLYNTEIDSYITVFGDRLTNETIGKIRATADQLIATKNHGNSETFLEILDYALDSYSSDDIIYFVEDDYIHRPGWADIISEGLDRVDYVSLYDHPDKYYNGAEELFHTKSSHWKLTHSTCMTFACKVSTLIYDADIFRHMITTGTPPDHFIFLELQKLGRKLATPIPGYATHGETEMFAPCINWEEILIKSLKNHNE